MAQKITPNLWFDGNAKDAVDFYTSVFTDSRILNTTYYPKTAEEGLAEFQKDLAGDVLTIEFILGDMQFLAINAGSEFSFNPSISFMVNFDPSRDEKAEERLQELWDNLTLDGSVLMPLDAYPFSKKYGWCKDRFGLTWQLILTNPEGEPRPFIIPSLMFSQGVINKAEEAINYYVSIFDESKVGMLARYETDTGPAKAGSIMFSDFMLAGQWFSAMDSGVLQDFTFNEAVSLSIACKNQDEINYFWEKLSAIPESEQCGWCKDKYGVSWQVVPENVEELLKRPNGFANMMKMKKLVIDDF